MEKNNMVQRRNTVSYSICILVICLVLLLVLSLTTTNRFWIWHHVYLKKKTRSESDTSGLMMKLNDRYRSPSYNRLDSSICDSFTVSAK